MPGGRFLPSASGINTLLSGRGLYPLIPSCLTAACRAAGERVKLQPFPQGYPFRFLSLYDTGLQSAYCFKCFSGTDSRNVSDTQGIIRRTFPSTPLISFPVIRTCRKSALFRVGYYPVSTVTARHPLSPASFTRTSFGLPCGPLSLSGEIRAYHVPHKYLNGPGVVCAPVVRHLRWVGQGNPYLTAYLPVQACQPLRLVTCNDACNGSHMFTLPPNPRSRLHRGSQSSSPLTV
jgi:hypothetical protein